jgi:glycine/D-amino acid oxidase-like deaminating enzyme
MVSPPHRQDVLVIGDGLIGLSTALVLSRDIKVSVVGTYTAGNGSAAAAGLLIPAYERLPEAARPFYADSMARYPALIELLRKFDPALTLIGGVTERTGNTETLHEADAAVDNVRLVAALRAAVSASSHATIIDDRVTGLEPVSNGIAVLCASGRRLSAPRVVLAAGAWSPSIDGLPRPLPVRPLKGQMLALGAAVLSRAIMDEDVYLVPRGNETLVGATVEEAGFDLTVTPDAIDALRRSAIALCPPLARAPITRSWAGTRPATPDMLPILGADPDLPALVYACGHSKNGVLLTPATAAAIAAVCLDRSPPTSIEPFSITRFFG